MGNTNKQKRPSVLKWSLHYTGKKRYILPLVTAFSALPGVLVLMPVVYIHKIVGGTILSGSVDGRTIRYYATLTADLAVAGTLLYFCASMISHLFVFKVEAGITKLGVKKMMAKPLGFFANREGSNLRKTTVDGAEEAYTMLVYQLPDLAMTIASPIMLLIFSFLFDWWLGLVSLVPMVITVLLMATVATPKNKRLWERYHERLANLSAESVEYVRGIPVVKTLARSVESSDRFYSSIVKLKDFVVWWSTGLKNEMSLYEAIPSSAAFFLMSAAIIITASGTDMREVLRNSVIYLSIGPVFDVLMMWNASMQNFAYFIELVPDEIDTALGYEDLTYGETIAAGEGLEFRDASFSCGKDRVLDNVSFEMNKDKAVALMGVSGGGKTTVARLTARFYDTDKGDIFIGGISIKKYKKEALSQKVAFVSQTSKFLKMSLRKSLSPGNPNTSDEEIEQVLVRAGAREIVDNLEKGLDTVYGTEGTCFSSGEIQRLSIARAFLKNVDFVILDKTTAPTDPENERTIQASFEELSENKTTLMVAHRFSTAVNADRILVMENGKIVKSDTHSELLTLSGVYKEL